ncbi:MAG: DUF1820 family protein [Pseudomonadota bacterium]
MSSYFILTYRDPTEGKIFSLKAARIHDSSLGLGFIAISDFLFDKDALVISPEQEALEKRLADVKTLHLSIYTVISVQEVGKQHKGLKFRSDKSKLLVFPTSPTQK